MKKATAILLLFLASEPLLNAQEAQIKPAAQVPPEKPKAPDKASNDSTSKQKKDCKTCGNKCASVPGKYIFYAEFDAAGLGSKASVHIPSSLPENALLVTHIKNVNPLVTRLFIKTSFINVDFSDGMDAFSQLLAGQAKDTSKQNTPANTVIKGNEKGNDISPAKPESKVGYETLLTGCLRDFWKHRNELLLFLGLDTSLYRLSQQPIISLDQLKKQLYARLQCSGLDTTSTCDIQRKRELLLQDLYKDYQCISDNYAELTKTVQKEVSQLQITPDKKDKDKKIMVEIVTKPVDNVPSTRYDSMVAYVKKFMQKIGSDSASAKMRQQAENITQVLEAVNSYTYFIQESTPQPVSGDTFYFSPTVRTLKGDTVYHVASIPIPTYGGKRTDFSTGIAFNFGGLLNETYRIERLDTANFTIRRNDQRNLLSPSLAAFIHMYRKVQCGLQLAYSFGVSTNPVNLESTTFYAGGSVMHMAKDRVVATIGIAAGTATRLVSRYNENAAYTYADHSGLQDSDLVEKKTRFGFFLAVSYNLTKRK